jgi:hypothetical protein
MTQAWPENHPFFIFFLLVRFAFTLRIGKQGDIDIRPGHER